MTSSGGPPGVGGATAYSGFGHVGDARHCYAQLARAFVRSGEVNDNVENDQLNIERYVTELALLLVDAIQATGKMFEEEDLRMIGMVTATNPGGLGGKGGNGVTKRGIMEYKGVTNLRCVNGDKSLFRQWHHKVHHGIGPV